jgi:quinone-modifying oxidoreductase subunit QmoC
MAALRRECISYYSSPNALGRWANHPLGLLIFGGISCCVFSLSLLIWNTTGGGRLTASTFGTRFALSFWSEIPRDLVVLLFSSVVIFDLMVLVTGIRGFWKALKRRYLKTAPQNSSASWKTTFSTTVFRIVSHHDFKRCANEVPKHANHTLVMCGMLGLVAVDLWIVFAPFNPLLHGLVYPLGPSEPWKFVANIAGLTLLIGICDMMRQRVQRIPKTRPSISTHHTILTTGANERKTSLGLSPSTRESETTGTFSDWLLLFGVAATVITGFAAELFHFARLDTLRWSIYVVHLFIVLTLLLVLPYSKLAHVAYRTAAFAFIERYGIRRNTTMNSPKKVIEH